MENKEPNQTPSSNPNQPPSSNPSRETTVPENNSRFLPENYSGLGFLPENKHQSYPGFDPSRLNPSIQLNPSYDWDSVLLNDYFDGLNLSTPHHQHMGPASPAESVLRSRAQSVARGQNGNLYGGLQPQELGSTCDGENLDYSYGGLYPQELGFTYNGENLDYSILMGSQNEFTGQPGSVYDRNSWINGSLFEPRPSSNQYPNLMGSQNGFTGQPGLEYDRNSWVNRSSFEPGPSSNQNGLFREHTYSYNGLNGQTGPIHRNNRINGPRFEPARSTWPSANQNGVFLDPYAPYGPSSPFSSRPSQGRSRPINTDMGWIGSSSNRNGLFRDSMYASNGLSRSRNGLFSKSMYASNGPNGSSLFSPRPSHDRRTVHSESGRVGPAYTGRLNMANGRPSAEYSNRNLKDFRGKIAVMAKNRDGSAFLKKKIEDGVEEDFELIFEEVKDDVAGLMVNYFGNSVVQKLFKGCLPEQISYMLNLLVQVKFKFAEICCDNHGSLAMEKLIQNLRTREQRSLIISALRGIVVNLSKDQNGLKVVQYCIVHFPENVDMLINEIADDCFVIATHKSGCVVLQDCLGRAGEETMERFIAELGPNILFLSEHPYGNYVVQYLLDKKSPSITEIVLSWLAGNYASLSMNKCSSNVVEKCLVVTREDEAAGIIVEIMNSDNFKMVIQNPYGNYVVQKALDVSQNMRHSDLHVRLENRIMSLHGSLNTHPFGNRVISKLNHRPKPF